MPVRGVAARSRVERRGGIGRVRKEPHHRARLLWLAETQAQHTAEGARDSLGGVVDFLVRARDLIFQPPANVRGKLALERVLVGEVVVEGALPHVRPHRDLFHAQSVDAARGEQSEGRVQKRLPRREFAPIAAIGDFARGAPYFAIWCRFCDAHGR